MRSSWFLSLGLLSAAYAVQIDQEEDQGIPDTGLNTGPWAAGTLPPLDDMLCLNDFQIAAKNVLSAPDYAYYRTAAADEKTYLHNMEIWEKVRMNRHSLADVSNVNLRTSILGHQFNMPFFITAAAAAGRAHPNGELNLVRAAGAANILYVASISSTKSIEEIANAGRDNQVMFHQEYIWNDRQRLRNELNRIENNGFQALVLTVDNFGVNGMRTRSQRFSGVGGGESAHEQTFTVQALQELRQMTNIPIVPKGVTSAAEVKQFADLGFPAVYISNHGGRQIDGDPTAVEILLDLHANYPEVFNQIEIYADGGVRRPQHILTLLALGVRAVGLGRSPMFANVFGQAGVGRMISNLRLELTTTMKNMGNSNIDSYRGNTTFINTREIEREYFGQALSAATDSTPFAFSSPQQAANHRR